MPDMSAIAGLLSSLKTSTDLTKALLGLRDAELVKSKALELNAEIFSARESALAAQAAQASLTERVRDLKKQIVELEDWNREKERYQLTEVGPSVFAYATKPGMEAGEPPHKICANCFQQRRKSILQGYAQASTWQTNHLLRCNVCKAEIIYNTTPHRFGED